MSLRNKILITAIWMSTINLCSGYNNWNNQSDTKNKTTIIDWTPKTPEIDNDLHFNNIRKSKKSTKQQIVYCLKTDENSFTHAKVLENIENHENTILELPLSQLFQKYWNRNHPLAVKWIKRNFKSLLWKWWIEELGSNIPQKLSPRAEKITSDTQYEAWDTLRFSLIDPRIKGVFPNYLADQLKEEWFKTFHDNNQLIISKKNKNQNQNNKNLNKPNFVYDIIVKKLPEWKSALALYKDWKLFMSTYVSVWLNNRKTITWQFEVLWTNPYYYSRKYKSPMSDCVYYDEWWRWFHQWYVTWYPESHGCVRLPGVYASILYSLVKNKKEVDVFIDKNLYIQKK